MSGAQPRNLKRGPSVLVTDAREARTQQTARPKHQRAGTRLISVDSVLQYASEIPSSQPRRTVSGGSTRPLGPMRSPGGRNTYDPKLGGRVVATGAAHIPARTSKTSEKLVLLPETTEEGEDQTVDFDEDDSAPPTDEALRLRKLPGAKGKTDAERLPKSQRQADPQLARVTAYCTAQTYRLRPMAAFVRDHHGAKTKLYDDCLYCIYHLPLLGGSEGVRVRSSPVLKNPGGRSILDEQIEANERREYREGWHEESHEFSVPNPGENGEGRDGEHGGVNPSDDHYQDQWLVNDMQSSDRRESNSSGAPSDPTSGISPDAYEFAELFIFSYGVAVFWNFTSNQEKDLLADLTFSSAFNQPGTSGGRTSMKMAALAPVIPQPLMTRPLEEDEFETEEFHFQYDGNAEKPRIFNDMITLRTSDHMIKLAMSHAIGQSTKLSYFEERMQRTMSEAQYVPRRLALEGRLGMTRAQVVGLVGRLFEGRVDVNLSSNMLESPSFFWDSEPTLHPLYQAVREYLEIKPRIQVLNERCRVFLDLAEILSDSIADVKMTRITWIIIVLILLSILVTCTEVFLRFAILAAGKNKDQGVSGLLKVGHGPSSEL